MNKTHKAVAIETWTRKEDGQAFKKITVRVQKGFPKAGTFGGTTNLPGTVITTK